MYNTTTFKVRKNGKEVDKFTALVCEDKGLLGMYFLAIDRDSNTKGFDDLNKMESLIRTLRESVLVSQQRVREIFPELHFEKVRRHIDGWTYWFNTGLVIMVIDNEKSVIYNQIEKEVKNLLLPNNSFLKIGYVDVFASKEMEIRFLIEKRNERIKRVLEKYFERACCELVEDIQHPMAIIAEINVIKQCSDEAFRFRVECRNPLLK